MRHLSRICVTGAFGFSGKYIAKEFISRGYEVITLTNRRPSDQANLPPIQVYPLDFSNLQTIKTCLQGGDIFINTYWVRFAYKKVTFEQAVKNSYALIDAAREAGVKRFIHISITNADVHSPLPYFRGKGLVEEYLQNSGMSFAILRPALIFGDEDILINNIAYLLRRFPLFAMPGNGTYKLQPVFVKDLAEICYQEATQRRNATIDVIGPETYTYAELIRLLCTTLGKHRWIIPLPPRMVYLLAHALGLYLGDNLLTWEEIQGLTSNLLYTHSSPTARTSLSQWVQEHKDMLGKHYSSELKRHFHRT